MLCKLSKVERFCPRLEFWPKSFRNLKLLAFLNIAAALYTPFAMAQASNFADKDGEISGTILLEADKRPASQVAVSLRSRVLGIFRSVLTDLEGHFKIQHLPRGTYEIAVDEQGYESARTDAQLDGPSSKLVLYLKATNPASAQKSAYMVSVHELKIPNKAKNEFNKGLELLARRDLAASVTHFAKATQQFPSYYEAYYHMGVAELRLGHTEAAAKNYQIAIDVSGGRYAWAEFGLGYVLCQEGNAAEAEAIIRRGLQIDDNSAEGYAILSEAMIRLSRWEEAEKAVHEALLRNPNLPDAYLMLSNVDANKGDYRAELADLDTYLRLAPNGPAAERVQKGREVVLRILKTEPQN
jgi:tetratricopeptide (TPR) repeat protein